MTQKQKEQIHNMYRTLQTIAKVYQTPTQLEKNCEKQYGLRYLNALEMSFENIQEDAKRAIKNVQIKKILLES